jgi:dienelactone hydrolase
MNTSDTPSLKTELLDYTDGETVFEAFVAHDAAQVGRRPCVLLGHDWSGLNGSMRAITERIAKLGYVGFALDLYGKGRRGDELGDNAALMNPLLEDRTLLRRRLLAGYEAASSHASVDPDRIVIVGYCFGGLCALDLARAVPPRLKGAVSIHGLLKPPAIGPQPPITASILLLHGWEDPMAPRQDVLAIAKELTDASADWQLHAYGHAMHAFTFERAAMPERGIAYNAAANRRSWQALTTFLAEVLAVA